MNVTLGNGKAVHYGHQFEDYAPTAECGGNKAAERYYITTDEVTCRKCIKWAEKQAERLAKAAAAEVIETPAEVIETPAEVTEVEAPATEVQSIEAGESGIVVELDMIDATRGFVWAKGELLGSVLHDEVRQGEPGAGWCCEDEWGDVVRTGQQGVSAAAVALLWHRGHNGPFLIKINHE